MLIRLDGILREEVQNTIEECSYSSSHPQETNNTAEEKTDHSSVDYRNDQSQATSNYITDVNSDCEIEESADAISEASSSGLPEFSKNNAYPLRYCQIQILKIFTY